MDSPAPADEISEPEPELARPPAPPDKPSFRRVARTVAKTLGLAWRASPRTAATMIGLTIITAALAPIVVTLSRHAVDLVAAAAQGRAVGVGQLVPWVAAMGALGALQTIFAGLQGNRQEIFAFMVNRQAERLFLEKASETELARFDDPAWHDRVQRVSRDINYRPYNLSYQSIAIVGALVTLAGMFGVLLSLHPVLLLLAVLSVTIVIPFERRINREIYQFWYAHTAKEREQWYYRWLLSDTAPAKDLRAYGLEGPLLGRHQRLSGERLRELRRLHRRSDRVTVLGGLLGGTALVAAYVFVAYRGAAGELSAGEVTALIAAIASVSSQVGSLSSSLVGIDQHAPFLEDFFDFLTIRPTILVPAAPAVVPRPLRGGISFEDVTFSYPGVERRALDRFDLKIADGEMVALVGDNGAGKTTLVKLLLRFYDPQGGTVRVGGLDLRDADPGQLRQRIGVLFQDYARFSMTARDAVLFGRIDAADGDDRRVWRALEAARADDLVRALPQQLDSYVGRMFEGGKDLSGGEWQRLALARLMFRDADLWILDEPTSSLDPEAEAAIFGQLKQELAGRIGIVISHRFSTVRIADRIVVMQDGRIVEVGSHQELMARAGRYARLFELQASAYR